MGTRSQSAQADRAAVELLLLTTGWLSRCSPAVQRAVLTRGRLVRRAAGAPVYEQGDRPNGLFALLDGAIAVEVAVDADSAVRSLFIGTPGLWFGESALLARAPRFATVRAIRASSFFSVPAAHFEALVADPEVLRAVAVLSVETFGRALHALADASRHQLRARVAGRLVAMASEQAKAGVPHPAVQASQAELAAASNLSRKSLNRILRGLAADGLVAVGYRRVIVLDLPALAAAAMGEATPRP